MQTLLWILVGFPLIYIGGTLLAAVVLYLGHEFWRLFFGD